MFVSFFEGVSEFVGPGVGVELDVLGLFTRDGVWLGEAMWEGFFFLEGPILLQRDWVGLGFWGVLEVNIGAV
jgi:hypothetical protein